MEISRVNPDTITMQDRSRAEAFRVQCSCGYVSAPFIDRQDAIEHRAFHDATHRPAPVPLTSDPRRA